jgi:hypothetical protein
MGYVITGLTVEKWGPEFSKFSTGFSMDTSISTDRTGTLLEGMHWLS